MLGQQFERFAARSGLDHLMSKVFQHGDGVEQHQPVVIHRQHLELAGAVLRSGCFIHRALRLRRPGGRNQPDLGNGALARCAADQQPSAHLLGHAMHHGKTQPGAFADTLGGEERLRSTGQGLRVHAFAAVGDGKTDIWTRRQAGGMAQIHKFLPRRDDDAPAARHGIARIDAQVQQRQFQLVLVGNDRPQRRWKLHLNFHVLAQCAFQEVGHAVHQRRQVQGKHFHGLAPCEGQHALGQGGAALGALDGIVHQAKLGRIIRQTLAQQLQAAEHRHQQVVEVVRHPAGQLADGVHLLGVEQGLAGAVQRILRFFAFGDVARDLGEAQQLSLLIAYGVNDDMRPETAAVLAQPPAFGFELAFPRRGFQRAGRHAPGAVLRRVEIGKMLADDFRRAVALDALGAGIPVGDDALGAEHVDGIVGDALNQQAKLLLALAQGIFRGAALGQVARHLGKAGQRARRIADGINDDMSPETGAILADPPAFCFELAFARRRFQGAGGQAAGAIFFGIEAGKMLADDFFGRITLETLGAGVPAGDDAAGVQHVDGIVGDRLDQDAVASTFIRRVGPVLRQWLVHTR